MGLIKCPDCNKMFSDRIAACPDCGCPIEEAIKEQSKDSTVVEQTKTHNNNEFSEFDETKKEKVVGKISSLEMNEFAIKAIIPELKKELSCENFQLYQHSEIAYPGLMLKTEKITIWLDVIVEIAPMYKSFIVNWENAKKANEKGWKYAVAHIGVGSKDTIRFERRIVLKNDAYYIRYEGLKYFDYQNFRNIRYSLSEENYDFIYKREAVSPYVVVKEVENHFTTYRQILANKTIEDYWNRYDLPDKTKEYLTEYFMKIGEAIDYCIPLKDVILNFWYCVDYCKGFLFSDSKPVSKIDIIPSCYKLLDANTLIDLSKYDAYLFAYMVYYYLESGEHLGEIENSGYLNLQKIKLFEEKPAYFGFCNLAEKKREKRRKNSSENIYKMFLGINNYLLKEIVLYQAIRLEINKESKKKTSNYKAINERIKELLTLAYSNHNHLIMNFDKDKQFREKELYSEFYKLIWVYIELLKKETRIIEKLMSKEKGGKYGLFEHMKDCKERDDKFNEVMNYTDRIKTIFHMPVLTENAKLLVPLYSHFFKELKEKYLEKIKNDSGIYGNFKIELCEFYDKMLMMPYDNRYKAERDFFLLNVTLFIELIELKEKADNEDVIFEKEEALFDNMEMIRENTYRMLIG